MGLVVGGVLAYTMRTGSGGAMAGKSCGRVLASFTHFAHFLSAGCGRGHQRHLPQPGEDSPSGTASPKLIGYVANRNAHPSHLFPGGKGKPYLFRFFEGVRPQKNETLSNSPSPGMGLGMRKSSHWWRQGLRN